VSGLEDVGRGLRELLFKTLASAMGNGNRLERGAAELLYKICIMWENVGHRLIAVTGDDGRRQRSATCRLSSLVRCPATRFGCGLATL